MGHNFQIRRTGDGQFWESQQHLCFLVERAWHSLWYYQKEVGHQMNQDMQWQMNDLQVEMLANKIRAFRNLYLKDNPNASYDEAQKFANKKCSEEAREILRDQQRIIKNALNQ
jgi:hypothetical protein